MLKAGMVTPLSAARVWSVADRSTPLADSQCANVLLKDRGARGE